MEKTYISALKTKLVLQLRQGDEVLLQFASEHKDPFKLLHNWPDQLLQGFAALFELKNLASVLTPDEPRTLKEKEPTDPHAIFLS